MINNISKIALGGGCHWCTEAVFQALNGIKKVEQGYVSSTPNNNSFSEAVIVHYDAEVISLQTLIEIHVHTHKSTSNHSMRYKYPSAIYTFAEEQKDAALCSIENLQKDFKKKLLTEVLPFSEFKASRDAIQDYYRKNPEKPFCKTFINPKLKLLRNQFTRYVNYDKLNHTN